MKELELRPPREDEAAAIADLFDAVTLAGYGTPDASEDEIRLWFTAPEVDTERDIRVAVARDGQLLGYGDVSDESRLHTRIWFDVRVRPGAGPAVAEQLLDALEPRALEFAAEAGSGEQVVLRGFAWDTEREVNGVYLGRGFEVVRHSFRMQIELDEEPPPSGWPEGIEVRTFDPEHDERAVYDAQNEGFADAWEYYPSPYEEWRHHMLGAAEFDPTLWFLATDGGEIAGICLCRGHEAETNTGWVRVLAVPPRWRRRGIAQALLRHAFREFRARGRRRVGLGVDAESTTGAIELYTRAGMRVSRKANIYDRAHPLAG